MEKGNSRYWRVLVRQLEREIVLAFESERLLAAVLRAGSVHERVDRPRFGVLGLRLGGVGHLDVVRRDVGHADVFRLELAAEARAVEGSTWGTVIAGFVG